MDPLLVIGKKIAKRFELTSLLGSGGFGNVFRATDLVLDRQVAVKIFMEKTRQPVSTRFRQEATFTAKIEHENAVRLYDAGVDPLGHYLILEFVDGLPAQEFFSAERSPAVAAMILMQVARALACAHAGDVIHRDVKPSNILVTPSGLAKLNDFGIARLTEDPRMSMTVTWEYASPEQLRGNRLTPATDLFSLGMTGYTFLTGTLPYPVVDEDRLQNMMSDLRPRLAEQAPSLGALGLLVDAMLDADPSRRPSAKDVADGLRTWLLPRVPEADIGLSVMRVVDFATRKIEIAKRPHLDESIAKSGIVGVFSSRDEIEVKYRLADVIAKLGNGRLRVVGKSLRGIVESADVLQTALRNGATIELALVHPALLHAELATQVSSYDVSATLDYFQQTLLGWVQRTQPPGKLYLKAHRVPLIDGYLRIDGRNIDVLIWDLTFGRGSRSRRPIVLDPKSELGEKLSERYDGIYDSGEMWYRYDRRKSLNRIPTLPMN